MTTQAMIDEERAQARRARNRSNYLRAKTSQEPALIRLATGERRILDQAALNAGLSRSAFAQLYLIPISQALTIERLEALDNIMRMRGVALSTAIGTVIDIEAARLLASPTETSDLSMISDAFDALFPTDDLSTVGSKSAPL